MKEIIRNSGLRHVKTEGELLPADILNRILGNDTEIQGLDPTSYGLAPKERLNEAINRSWQRMISLWPSFQEARARLGEHETGIPLTRQTLLYPLFSELGYGRLQSASTEERTLQDTEGHSRVYAISHMWEASPIHLVGCSMDIDKRVKGVTGAAQASPHGIVQEFLNRSANHLWGFVSNGLVLRILRDNASLSRQAYIEFDLAAIFDNLSFSDFTLLWLLCHCSRVEKRIVEDEESAPKPEGCYLELWTQEAQESALVALETLSGKVETAICILGRGFLEDNPELWNAVVSGRLPVREYFHELLRFVYRLIFCFVAEDRNLLHAPATRDEARERYDKYFSFRRLRQLSRTIAGTRHIDLFEGVKFVMNLFGSEDGCIALGISPMGGFLWSKEALPHLLNASLKNQTLLSAIRVLSFAGEVIYTGFFKRTTRLRPIDYQHLGARELGSIYESLLESHPVFEDGKFQLMRVSGNERKKTGAYYTPAELINCLLESALDPVLERAAHSENPETAILSLRICDPSCGSGHFLLAAAHRMGERLAEIRVGESRNPSPRDVHRALREVISHCIYGVDINPMSVELCKVSLWMESMEEGKPLSFLDHHILCANSLLGTSRKLIFSDGLPDEAFTALEGDDKEAVRLLKKRNKEEKGIIRKKGQKKHETVVSSNNLFDLIPELQKHPEKSMAEVAKNMMDAIRTSYQKITAKRSFEDMPTDTVAELEAKDAAYRDFLDDPDYQRIKMLEDLWCAAFVMPRFLVSKNNPFGITQSTIQRFAEGKELGSNLEEVVRKTAEQYQFLHWELAFPEVFSKGGFDVMLGNPPWERIKIQEKEWFASRNSEIANAQNASVRGKMIEKLQEEDPELYEEFSCARKVSYGASHFIRSSRRFPFCGRGDINLYPVFAENMRNLVNDHGRVGCIVPTGIATDDTTKFFFKDMVKTKSLVSLFDFENRRKKLFPAIDSRMKFSLLTTGNGKYPLQEQAEFVFFALDVEDLHDKEKCFTLSLDDIALINPNTYTCPIFRNRKESELTKEVYHRIPVLSRITKSDEKGNVIEEENPWRISFSRMFDMSNDSWLFRTREQLESADGILQGNRFFVKEDSVLDTSVGEVKIASGNWLPLYEAKMIHLFNHRWATCENTDEVRDTEKEELVDPNFCIMPKYWVHEKKVHEKLESCGWNRPWLMGWRKICRSTDERTVVGGMIPTSAVGDSIPLWLPQHENYYIIVGILSSYACDFFTRLKIGGSNLNFFIARQIPVITLELILNSRISKIFDNIIEFIEKRIRILIHTSYDLPDTTSGNKIYVWNSKQRYEIILEINAIMFHLYLPCNADGGWLYKDSDTLEEMFKTPRDAVEYIMNSFNVLWNKDEEEYGQYYTKNRILEFYDSMLNCLRSNIIYKNYL